MRRGPYHSSRVLKEETRSTAPKRSDPGTVRKIYWSPDLDTGPSQEFSNVKDLVKAMERKRDSASAVCIIQDITSDWGKELRQRLGVRAKFFSDHQDRLWDSHRHPWDPPDENEMQWRSVDAMYVPPNGYGTRISYYRMPNRTLESPPLIPKDRTVSARKRERRGRNRTCLRLAYSADRVGLTLPYLLDSQHPTFSMYEFLERAMSLTWPRECLFKERTHSDVPPALYEHPILYVLADFAWAHNLQYLDENIKKVSFENIQTPHRDVAATMHGFREEVDYLKSEVGHMIRYTPPGVTRYLDDDSDSDSESHREFRRGLSRPYEMLVDSSERIAEDAKALEEFLTSSLEILIASIALRDSRRADMLTWLAAIYVPLSFVTGIFGMNLRELNDSDLPVWICFEVLGVVLIVTAALVVMYKLWEKYGGVLSRQSKRGREAEDGLD